MSGQVFQFPFRHGLAEGDDPKDLPPGSLLTALNCQADKSGRLAKRFGTTGLSKNIAGGGTLAAGKRIFARGSELCMVDGTSLYSWSPGTGAWVNTGKIGEVGLTWTTAVDTTRGVQSSDVAVLNNGNIVHAWVSGDPTQTTAGNVYVQVFDSSGVRVTEPTSLIGSVLGNTCRVITDGTNYAVLWVAFAGAVVEYSWNGAAGAALTTSVAVSTGRSAFDAQIDGSNFWLAYEANGGGIELEIMSFVATPVSQTHAAVTGTAAVGYECIGINGTAGENLYVGFSVLGTGILMAVHNPATLAQTLAPTSLDTGSGPGTPTAVCFARFDSSHAIAMYAFKTDSIGGVFAEMGTVTKVISSAGAVTADTRRISFSTMPLTKPFALNGRWYMALADAYEPGKLNAQNSYLVEIETSGTSTFVWPHRYVGKVDVLIGGPFWALNGQVLPNAALLSSGNQAVLVLPFQASVTVTFGSQTAAVRAGVRLVTASVGASLPSDMWRTVVIQNEACIAAGVLFAYDGRRPFDYGFAAAPWIDTNAVVNATTGGHLEAGARLWGGYPEYRDALGIVHRGPTAIAFSVTTTGTTSTVTMPFAAPTLSCKQPSAEANAGTNQRAAFIVYTSVYRTIVGGAVLFKLGLEPLANVLPVNFTASPDLYVDGSADAAIGPGGTAPTLASRPQIYTNGGELDDYQPPALSTLTVYRNRLFGVAGDGRTIWVSKDYSGNAGTAPGFHPTQIILVADNVVAMTPLDDKLVILGATALFFIAGDGPDVSGNNSDYGEPLRLTVELGCANARGVVSAPPGIFYLSNRGIELLDRKLNVSWVGRAVRDDLAAYPVVTSAVHVVDQHEVRFTCNTANGANGIVLAYDYEARDQQGNVVGAWYARSYTDAADTNTVGMPIADACYANGVYTLLTPGGEVYQENKANFLDNGTTWVTRDVQISWVSPAGKLSWHRTKAWQVLGTVVGNHQLELSVSHDYLPTWDTVTTFVDGGEGTVGPLQRIRKACLRQKVQSTRVRLRDLPPSNPGLNPVGTGAGPIWEGLGLHFMPKPGLPRTPTVEQG